MLREILRQEIEKAAEKLYGKKIDFSISSGGIYGDYSSNVAMLAGGNPRNVAERMKRELFISKEFSNFVSKIEIASQGFLNFRLSEKGLEEGLKFALKNKFNFGNNGKVQVEFLSANPTGPLTVGNARGGPFGDTLANVFKIAGYKIEKAYYINDWGNQILILGHSVLKDSEAQYSGEYIDYLNKKIKEKDPFKAGQEAAKIIIKEMIKKTVEKMGIKFDEWFSETSLHESGQVNRVLDILKKKNLIYEKEGALWFRSTEYGDTRDRVLIKSDKTESYLAGDIAYHLYKFKKKKFDKVINIWGADHYGDVPGLRAGMAVFGLENKLEIILLQFITILEKGEKMRMSKRAGTYVTMDELIDDVGRDAVRFFFLQRAADTHLEFDLDLAKEQSKKNPVYYVQYAHARACSILRKSGLRRRSIFEFLIPKIFASRKFCAPTPRIQKLILGSEKNLILKLIQFPEIIEDIAKDYQVHRLTTYVYELAKVFTDFYENVPVLKAETEDLKKSRLALVLITRKILEKNLSLMGISAPDKM